MSEFIQCIVCGKGLTYRWTDTHGVGACVTCGMCYKIFHYEGEGEGRKRIDKPPTCATKPEWLPLITRYWEENRRNCDPGAYNFPGSSYEVASKADFDTYNAWMQDHESEFPVEPTP